MENNPQLMPSLGTSEKASHFESDLLKVVRVNSQKHHFDIFEQVTLSVDSACFLDNKMASAFDPQSYFWF